MENEDNETTKSIFDNDDDNRNNNDDDDRNINTPNNLSSPTPEYPSSNSGTEVANGSVAANNQNSWKDINQVSNLPQIEGNPDEAIANGPGPEDHGIAFNGKCLTGKDDFLHFTELPLVKAAACNVQISPNSQDRLSRSKDTKKVLEVQPMVSKETSRGAFAYMEPRTKERDDFFKKNRGNDFDGNIPCSNAKECAHGAANHESKPDEKHKANSTKPDSEIWLNPFGVLHAKQPFELTEHTKQTGAYLEFSPQSRHEDIKVCSVGSHSDQDLEENHLNGSQADQLNDQDNQSTSVQASSEEDRVHNVHQNVLFIRHFDFDLFQNPEEAYYSTSVVDLAAGTMNLQDSIDLSDMGNIHDHFNGHRILRGSDLQSRNNHLDSAISAMVRNSGGREFFNRMAQNPAHNDILTTSDLVSLVRVSREVFGHGGWMARPPSPVCLRCRRRAANSFLFPCLCQNMCDGCAWATVLDNGPCPSCQQPPEFFT